MATRKRRYKSLQQSSPTSYSQDSEIEPSLKRRRLSLGNLSPNQNNSIHNHRQHYLTNNLIKLRNDTKISDVTFIVTDTNPAQNSNSNNSNHKKTSQSNPSLSEDENQDETDSNVRKFYCIKALFAANSEVFKNLLYGDFNEAHASHPNIEIKDITVCAFQYIRDLFYHFNPVLTSDIVIDVSIAAHRYFINELMFECINYLRNISNLSKWFRIIFEIQRKYNNCFGIETYLKALIDENYMLNNCSVIIFADLQKLYQLNVDMFCRIIASDNIHLCEEIIWHKCIGYALHKTQQKCEDCTSLPKKIKTLIQKHLSIPKQIYDEIKSMNNDKKEREYILSQVMDLSANDSNLSTQSIISQKNNIKNMERIIVKDRDILLRNDKKSKRNNGDIVIDDSDDCNNEYDSHCEDEEDMHLDTFTEKSNDFVQYFENIMRKLAKHIRFTLMLPMFFIKLCQFSDILPLEKVIEIQNYLLCKVMPNSEELKLDKREKRYLKYFKDIQAGISEIKKSSKMDNNINKSMRKSKIFFSESEEQKQDNNGYDQCEYNEYNECLYENDTFFNNEMCFDQFQFSNLSIDDHIDHRDNVGRFATAVIVDIDKNRNKVKLHYIGWQSKWDLWCDISAKCQQIRFCYAGSISTREIHRKEFKYNESKELKDTKVKCRLAKYWYRNHPNIASYDCNEWREAVVKRVDKHSGQTQLVVRIGSKDYLWWVHLDSCDEVQPSFGNGNRNNQCFMDLIEDRNANHNRV